MKISLKLLKYLKTHDVVFPTRSEKIITYTLLCFEDFYKSTSAELCVCVKDLLKIGPILLCFLENLYIDLLNDAGGETARMKWRKRKIICVSSRNIIKSIERKMRKLFL